ncbi:MAG TPA: GLUG motif-containing protein [Rhizomicrobium sp.]|nr:GLUG motif-containing protein [Rhizomicrobium sp.]
MLRVARLLATAVPLGFCAASAHAAIIISTAATQNMSCTGGICAPTATDAVLNVTDLENLLASGNLTVTTTGSGVQGYDVNIRAPFEWASASALTLDAYRSVSVNQQVSVWGVAELAILTNGGSSKGSFEFGKRGRITFANLSSQLTINGILYRLENNLKNLAYDIARMPRGAYALAGDYDASGDGVYTSPPIGAEFSGTFSGLGSVISNLTVVDHIQYDYVGLFYHVSKNGAVNAVRLSHVVMQGLGTVGGLAGVSDGTVSGSETSGRLVGGLTGGLVGQNNGTIEYSHATDRIKALVNGVSGGLVGENTGTITNSWSAGSISGRDSTSAGGLVAYNTGNIAQGFSTDTVTCENYCGGLSATNTGTIINSYSTGSVSGYASSFDVGGFIGVNYNGGVAKSSYSTGVVSGKRNGDVGGFFGADQGSADSSYWDTETSGTDFGSGDGNDSGITGLTTEQFQAGLPSGFDPKVWVEDPSVNNGFPYLLANRPPK